MLALDVMSPKQQAALICVVVQKNKNKNEIPGPLSRPKREHAVITRHCCQTKDDVDTKILALSALVLFLLEEESRKRKIRRKVRRTKWVTARAKEIRDELRTHFMSET